MRVGIVGFGFMGRTHFGGWQKIAGAEIAAICESNPAAVEDARGTIGNIEGAAAPVDLGSLPIYTDLNQMLKNEQLDAVSIALPTHLHQATTVQALAAGAHVLCEKPMALTIEQCDRMIEAARRAHRTLMVGQCIRFWPEYVAAREIVRAGTFGPVRAAVFQRFGSMPLWSGARNWFTDTAKSGGVIMDLQIHDSDFVLHLLGRPAWLQAIGARTETGALFHVATQYGYESASVTAEASWAMMPGAGFHMNFWIALERATIVFDAPRRPPFRVFPHEGKAFTPQVAEGDGWVREIRYFADVVSGKDVETVLTPESSRESVRVALAGAEAVERGERIALGETTG